MAKKISILIIMLWELLGAMVFVELPTKYSRGQRPGLKVKKSLLALLWLKAVESLGLGLGVCSQ
jgi:hypothetical protein